MNRLLVAAALCCIGLAPAHADLVVNGDFEATPIGTGTYATLTSIPGWTGAPTIEIQDRVAGTPFSGNNLVELDTTSNSAMYQDIDTVIGQAYEISFAYSPRPGIALSSNGIEFRWNGAPISSIAQSGADLADTSWTRFTFDEVAVGTTSRIGFAAFGTSDSFGGYLDDVAASALVGPDAAVSAVPEPGTWSLWVAGLALLALTKRRRKAARVAATPAQRPVNSRASACAP